MNFTLIDLGELLISVLSIGLILVAPGMVLARAFGIARAGEKADPLVGLVVGLAVLPVLDSLVTRFIGIEAALGLNLILGVAAIVGTTRLRSMSWPTRIGAALTIAWLLIVALETVDFDVAGKLYQPLTVFDMVKHAATTQAIFDSGAPPRDAFFLRPERASYYYFFYTLPALAMRLSFGFVDAKAAFAGMVFWTGVGSYGLVRLTMQRTGLDRRIDERRTPWLIVAVFAAAGLDILAVFFVAIAQNYWIADPLRWNEQAGAWFEDLLWVPHHVAALSAGMLGLLALCEAIEARIDREPARHATVKSMMFAALCFASCLGLSVWVTFGFVLAVVVWLAILLRERQWRAVLLVSFAGLTALVVALPQILDLRAGRAVSESFPIVAMIRPFMLVEQLVPEQFQPVANLLTLPLSYGIEFGVLALGAFVFWRRHRSELPRDGGEFHRVLTIAALVGLVVGAVLRSIILNNNDLGWRVLLMPLLAGTVWTVFVVDRALRTPAAESSLRSAFAVLFGLGWATVLYTAIAMRAYPFMTINPKARFIAADPATERALRVAYGWANAHLSHAAVLQQNPTFRRAFAFGMYGRNPIGVSDTFAGLYGADPQAVAARLESLGPIFQDKLPTSDISARAAANGIDDLIVTAADPVWQDRSSFLWRAKPVFSSARVRIIPVGVLEASR